MAVVRVLACALVVAAAALVCCGEARPLNDVAIYTTFKPKHCPRVTKNGDAIQMHYDGHLETMEGAKFDSSYDRNEPLGFTLGAGQVIQAGSTLVFSTELVGWDDSTLLDTLANTAGSLKDGLESEFSELKAMLTNQGRPLA